MESTGGIPWLGGPITLHAWREYTCTLDTEAQCEYQEEYWRFWYEADHRYAVPTVGFFLAVIIVFALINIGSIFLSRRMRTSKRMSKAQAAFRYLSYRSLRVRVLDWNSAPIGVLLLAAIGVIFFFCMTLAPKPYYWPSTIYGSSPPIATRTGWMALGCMPFVFATAGKSNFITAVTGVSHEKLQVFHRWISYAFFVLSLIHTFPFIIHNIDVGEMEMQWKMSVFYWTGVIALLAQGWLTFASWGPIRNLCYEWFKFAHFTAALVFMLFLFFHCDYTLSAWDYFIATGVLFAGSWLHRQIRIYFEHGINNQANLTITSNGFIQVSVPTKPELRWRVGQHFFVRFLSLGLHGLTIHPFTACSLPAFDDNAKPGNLEFFIRPRGGFTARLARFITSRQDARMRVLLDGPYGGVDMLKIQQSQRILIIAGGSGAGWTLPFILAHLRRVSSLSMQSKSEPRPLIRVILATRDIPTKLWYEAEVRRLAGSIAADHKPSIDVQVYFTGSADSSDDSPAAGQFLNTLDDLEKVPDIPTPQEVSDSDSSSQEGSQRAYEIRHLASRPDLPSIIHREASSTSSHGSLGIFVCGPLSMQADVSTATAIEELRLMKQGVGQIYLHMEHFSWA